MDAPLRAHARALARRAVSGDDPDFTRAIVQLVSPSDERHAVAVSHLADDADLLAAISVGVVIDLADSRLFSGDIQK
jgi:hypothetical protein